jgi:hypothetical protein
MNSVWEMCPRGETTGRWAELYVSLNRRGYIVFNRRTHERLGSARAVHLLFDRVNSRIGVRPAAQDARDAFPVRKYGRHGGRLIRARRLVKEFGLTVEETLHFQNAEIDENGLLVLDLRDARIVGKA